MTKSHLFFFFQAEDGIRDFCLSRGLGDVYKRQVHGDEVKNLINQLLTFDPIYRINMADLMRNQWLNGEIPEQAEIQTLFDEVRQEILSNTTILPQKQHFGQQDQTRQQGQITIVA
eukprot:TRINITY_DN3417_c0_g1_i1.p1 TRINITY_DN3417_c0_g1~~TRINITY_DN3417_c0_g1_i1.p1  ORF type:complete len:116 (-),score=41.03 TRINITY_DN3417_c0_g1_i1:85-432(-)